tara:strand:+ start:20400 stop:20657 length:258 start_codon:yes stop_codon:yes gene_type:complete
MDKFLNFDNVGFVGTSDIIYVKLDGGEIFLINNNGMELQIAQASTATAADKATIDAALVKIWSKGYTDSVLDVSLSSAVNEIVPN